MLEVHVDRRPYGPIFLALVFGKIQEVVLLATIHSAPVEKVDTRGITQDHDLAG